MTVFGERNQSYCIYIYTYRDNIVTAGVFQFEELKQVV